LKRGSLNKEGLPTGKKSLDQVRAIFNEKALTIRPAQIKMYHHHCIAALFKYLVFEMN
jgi:hypothetical protein